MQLKPMKHPHRLSFVALLVLLASACAREEAEQAPPPPAIDSSGAQEFAAFEISWPRPSSAQVDARAKTLSEVMLGQALAEHPFAQQLKDAATSSPAFNASLRGSNMMGRYRHGADELLLNNNNLLEDATSAVDIGETAARARFVDIVQQLNDASLVDGQLFDLNAAIVSQTKFSTGSSDSDNQVDHVLSYDFLVRQSLNGIPFVNAGVRVSVHRSGAIAAIRLGGAVAAASVQKGRVHPLAPGYVFRAKVDEKYFQERFATEYPNAQLNSKGILYMLPYSVDPEAGQKQVLEPEYVFNFANHYGGIVARRRYVGYSLSNPSAPAHDMSPPPTPNITGDPRPQETPAQPELPASPVGQ